MPLLTDGSPRDTDFRFPNRAVSLLPHQQALLYCCGHEIEDRERKRCAVMNDPPGSGKTFVLFAMVCRDLLVRGDGPSTSGGSFVRNASQKRKTPPELSKKTIIVVPFNIYTQWMEVGKRCCCSDDGSELVRIKALVEYGDVSSLLFSPEVLRRNDVILTTTLFYPSISAAMQQQRYAVKRVVFDEVDRVSGLLSETLVPCDHVWLMSASLNNMMSCVAFGNVIARELCGKDCARDVDVKSIAVRCDDAFVADSFRLPRPDITYVVSHKSRVDVMSGVLSPEAMEALNACAYDSARLLEHSGISCARVVSSPKELMQVLLRGRSEALYRLRDEIETDDAKRARGQKPRMTDIDRATKAAQLKEHETFVDKMTARLRDHDICSICMESVSNVVMEGDETGRTDEEATETAAIMGCCFNRFCLPCLEQWRRYKDACPMCRAPLRENDACVVADEHFKRRIGEQAARRIEEHRKKVERKIRRQEHMLEVFMELINERTERSTGGASSSASYSSSRARQRELEKTDASLAASLSRMYETTRACRSLLHDNDKVADVTDIVLRRITESAETSSSAPKIIVFSDKTSLFTVIAQNLDSLGIAHSELDGGNIQDMDAIIRRYKTGDMTVLMANSSMFDCGMNLENTTDIVFVHKIASHAKYNQVLGRAQRYGRTQRLMVWQLYHENELLDWLGAVDEDDD